MTPRAAAARTAAALLSFYLLTGSGGLFTPDDVAIFRVAQSLADGHGWSADPAGIEGWGARGADGRFYPQFAPLQSVLLVPAVVAERAAGLPPAFLASFLHAFTTAAAAFVFILLLCDLGASSVGAAAAAVMTFVATPLWPYATYSFPEPLVGLGLLVAVRHALRGGMGDGAIAGAGLAAAALARQEALLAYPAVWIACAVRGRAAAAACLAVSVAGPAGLAAHNIVRFGAPLATGHESGPGAWSLAQIPTGLLGNLVAPGKGLVWFAPPALVALAGWPALARRRPGAAALVAGVALPIVVAGCAWHSWMGGYSWGPRRWVPVMPLLFLPVAFISAHPSCRAEGGRPSLGPLPVFVLMLALLGAAVNAAGVGAHFADVLVAAESTGPARFAHPLIPRRDFYRDTLWNPRFSPLVDHARLVLHGAGRRPVLGRLGERHPLGAAVALGIGLLGVGTYVPLVRSAYRRRGSMGL